MEAFGNASWACHQQCGDYTMWRIVPEDAARLFLYVCMYVYICVCVCIILYIYIIRVIHITYIYMQMYIIIHFTL